MAKKPDHLPNMETAYRCPICGNVECHIFRIVKTRKVTKTGATLYMRQYHPFRCRNSFCQKWCANERGYCWACGHTTLAPIPTSE